MLKKLSFSLLAISVLPWAHAFELPGDYYMGALVGYGWSEQELKATNNLPSGTIDGNLWDLSAVSGIAWNGLNGSYLAIEGELEFSKRSTERFNDGFSGDNYGFAAGLYGKAGWWFWQSTLFYGKVGVKETYMSFSDGGDGTFQSLEYGLGAEYILNLDWTLRGEYSYEQFNKNDDIFKNYSLESSENMFSIGIIRHF